MLENLKFMQAEFNRAFEERLNLYKSELRSRFKEFKDMPEDVVLVDLERGIFMERDEYTSKHRHRRRSQRRVKSEKILFDINWFALSLRGRASRLEI
jgi:intein/homing endonuclease